MGSANNFWRAAIALGVVIALPILATPKVSTAVSNWLYGDSDKVVPPLPELKVQADDPTAANTANTKAEFPDSTAVSRSVFEQDINATENKVGQATFLEPRSSAAEGRSASPPLTNSPAPPLLSPPPQADPFDRQDNSESLTRVREIKDQLASWGAEYILLEALEDGKKFRFCCLMTQGADQDRTFPFEATAPDPYVAAASVKTAVQAWREQQGAGR